MIFLLMFSFLAIAESQTHQQPFCSSLGNFYDSMCPTQVDRSSLGTHRGIQGKRGPIGERGEPGLKGIKGMTGNDGEVDYDRVEEMISRRMEEVLRNQSRKFTELSSELMEAKKEVSRLANKSDYCPIKFNGKCFWFELRYTNLINFEQGRQICSSRGGVPANIYSEDHYIMLLGYLRMFAGYGTYTYMNAWLGMTYSTQTNTALLSDGSRAPFVKWRTGYPRSSPCCNIDLLVRMDWQSKSQHMTTAPPSFTYRGVICEK